ncbi:winged helix DNA-binding domain-containing protein, partial [Backusella circina FSU 941]
MVNDPKADGDIYWAPSGEKVIIRNRDDFSNKVLPYYYKHNKWSSFVRQLNVYGFCTKQYTPCEDNPSQPNERVTYTVSHPQFKKDSNETLINITR